MGTCFSKSSTKSSGFFAEAPAPVPETDEVRREAIKGAIQSFGQFGENEDVRNFFHREDIGACALATVYMQLKSVGRDDFDSKAFGRHLDVLIDKLQTLEARTDLSRQADMLPLARALLPRLQAERALCPAAEESAVFRV